MSAFTAAKDLSEETATIWVFQTDFEGAHVDELHEVLDPFPNVKLEVRSIDLSPVSGVKGLHGDVMPFSKLILPRIMTDKAQRFVYLDADTVVVDGLRDLYQKDLEGHTLAAVSYKPLNKAQESDFFEKKGLDTQKKGFNSGVLVVDTEKWNRECRTDRLLEELVSTRYEWTEGDQPFLNLVFYDDFLPLRIKYNKRAGPGWKMDDKYTANGIIHFVGIPKPWDIGGKWLNKNYPLYENHRKQADVPSRSILKHLRQNGVWRTIKGAFSGVRKLSK